MPTMLFLTAYGPNAWLITSEDHQHLQSLGRALELRRPKHFKEYSLGYETLLIQYLKPVSQGEVEQFLSTVKDSELPANTPAHHEIPVIYNGPDLEESARKLKLSCEELIQIHSSALYQVRFLGFSPGFPYLDGLPERIHLPRRSSPRTRMQAGAVAIGGSHASIYTIPSPGGWHWLGNTEHPIFDRNQTDASTFTLKPSDTLTFIPQHA